MQSPVLDYLLQQNTSGLPVKDFLQQLAAEHPYFSPARFFLLQQLNETDSTYNNEAATAGLLFNNPYWLHFKLHQVQQPATAKETPVIPMYAENTDNDDDNAQLVTGQPIAEANTLTAGAAADELPQYEATALNNANDIVEVTPVNEVPGTALMETPETAVTATAAEPVPYPENTDNDDDTAVLVNEQTAPDTMPDIKIDLSAALKSAENENAPAFEPMHLVDYFASQGIKLSEEIQSADKLGKQLKSFTEWLKTMKKVHAAEAAAAGGSGTEVAIQALAEKSNAENEVITEAMAEVFAQQGKAAKAIELYQKLSLLNPAKSAYFAAKLENLKGQ